MALARSGPPERRTRLKRGGPLKRRTRLQATSMRWRDRKGRTHTIPAAVHRAVVFRSGGRCEMVGCAAMATSEHHRKMRSQGGLAAEARYLHLVHRPVMAGDADHPAWIRWRDAALETAIGNLAHLCDDCHRYIHDHPEWAYARGWLTRSWQPFPDALPTEGRPR